MIKQVLNEENWFIITDDQIHLRDDGASVTLVPICINLPHKNIVKGSFISNVPCIVNYEEGRLTVIQGAKLNEFMAVHIKVSYNYEDNVREQVIPLPLPG